MIKRLKLVNFQKHKKRTIIFDPLVTTIVGKTNAGKSTIIRMLGLICLNHWDSCYVRHGKSFVIGNLDIDDRKIVRKKGKGKNIYSLDGKVFRAFATSIPEEIAELLNIGPENFQRQLDPHFWFSDTPGQVSKKLNEIVNLGAIDRTTANINSEIRSAKAELEVSASRLREAKETAKELEWITSCDRDLQALEQLEEEAKKFTRKRAALASLVEESSRLEAIEMASSTALVDAEKLKALARQSVKIHRQAKSLAKLLARLKKADKQASAEVPDLTEVEAVRKQGDKVAEDRRELEILVDEVKKLEGDQCRLEKKIELEEKLLRERTKGKCPVCGRSMKSTRLHCPIYTSGTRPR